MAIPVLSDLDFGSGRRGLNHPTSTANGELLVHEQKGQLLQLPFSTTLGATDRTTAWIADHPSGAGAYTWNGTAWAAPAAATAWATPGAIGSTTPNTGVFIQLASSKTLLGVIPDGTTLVRATHIGRSLQVDGGTITIPADANWQTGDEFEVLVVGTNATTIAGNGANIYYYGGGPFPSVIMGGTSATRATFKKLGTNVVHAYTVPITLGGLNDVAYRNSQNNSYIPSALGTSSIGQSLPINPFIAYGWNTTCWFPPTGSQPMQVIGCSMGASNVTGASTAASIATTNIYTRTSKVEYLVTTAAATSVAGLRDVNGACTIGGASTGVGGFICKIIGAPATGVSVTTHRFFMGMRASTTAPTDVEPSSITEMLGIGYDSTDVNVQFMHRGTGGAATKIDLGTGFPVPTTDRSVMYELLLNALPGTSQIVYYSVRNLGTGSIATGIVSTNIPASTVTLARRVWASVGGTSSVIGVGVGSSELLWPMA